jgi:hypothetical protein
VGLAGLESANQAGRPNNPDLTFGVCHDVDIIPRLRQGVGYYCAVEGGVAGFIMGSAPTRSDSCHGEPRLAAGHAMHGQKYWRQLDNIPYAVHSQVHDASWLIDLLPEKINRYESA